MFYLDSSVLIKKYVFEPGASVVRELLESRPPTASSILTRAEIEAALGRLHREGRMDEEDLHKQQAAFLDDWKLVRIVGFREKLFREIRRLVFSLPLRAGDAVQLASALILSQTGDPITFCSADDSLLRSAAAE